MSDNEKLDEILKSFKKKESPSEIVNDMPISANSKEMGLQPVNDVRETICANDQYQENLGFIDKMKFNSLEREKKLEAQRIIFDTKIERLKHQVIATERQSKAYWNTKSVDFAEGLKTYAQASLHILENARQENKSSAIINACKIAHDKMIEVINSNLTDDMKEELIKKISITRDNSIERIDNNTLAKKYDLD